jgi:hypothetical protein
MLLALSTQVCTNERAKLLRNDRDINERLIGATFLSLDSDAYNAYRYATGANLDPYTGLLFIHPAQFPRLKDMKFTISNVRI